MSSGPTPRCTPVTRENAVGDRERFTPSVVYRDSLTSADYDDAIFALHQAKQQDQMLKIGCSICHDSGHIAEDCHHNPLLLARKWLAATSVYRCFHCGYVALNDAEARAHFGNSDDEVARCVRLRAEERHHGGHEVHDMVTLGFHVCMRDHSPCPGLQQTVPDTHASNLTLVAAAFPPESPVALLASATGMVSADLIGLVEIWEPTVAFVLGQAVERVVWVTRDHLGHYHRITADRHGRGERIAQPLFVHGHRARSEEAFRVAFGDTATYLLARLGGLQELQRAYAAQGVTSRPG